jgi:hypothetical protein
MTNSAMLPQPNPYSTSEEELHAPAAPPNRGRIIAIVAGVAVLMLAVTLLTAVVAFVLGGIVGQTQLYHQRADEQADKMRVYLGEHEEKYSGLTIDEASDGWSYLDGTVKSQEDLDQLRSEMQRLFGEELGEDMTAGVEVTPAEPPQQP